MNRRELIAALLTIPSFAAHVNAKAAGRPVKNRPCDGACCHESPLRPVGDGKECFFHDHTMQFDVNSGCKIMADPRLLKLLNEEELRRFAEGCIGYPIPYTPAAGYGNCCYGENHS